MSRSTRTLPSVLAHAQARSRALGEAPDLHLRRQRGLLRRDRPQLHVRRLDATGSRLRRHRQLLAGVTGFWTVAASDFHPPNGWATIATSGTCQFAIQFQVPSQTQGMFIGTNDLRFYINNYVGFSQNGHIQSHWDGRVQ